jgi:hypothetical protein
MKKFEKLKYISTNVLQEYAKTNDKYCELNDDEIDELYEKSYKEETIRMHQIMKNMKKINFSPKIPPLSDFKDKLEIYSNAKIMDL